MSRKIMKLIDSKAMWIHSMLMCFKHRKDVDFQNKIVNKHLNPYLWELESRGEGHEGKILCDINPVNREHGFFAGFRYTLDALFFIDRFGLVPVVHYGKNSKYYDEKMPAEIDPFNYYFKDTSALKRNDLINAKSVLVYMPNHHMLSEQLNQSNYGGYRITSEYISTMGRTMNKYISFNETTQYYLNSGLESLRINEKTLGIHIRGTDYRIGYKSHPIYIGPEDYFPLIDTALKEYHFDSIFLATDDIEILQEFQRHYPEVIVFYNDIHRGDGTIGVHDSDKNGYELGLEVIRDMFSLANCGGLIAGMSQVSLATRITKKSMNEKFKFLKILTKGTNVGGKRYKSLNG